MNKAKELLNKLKEFVSLHKVVCLSAAGAVCAVAVTGIVVAVVLGNHSKTDTVGGRTLTAVPVAYMAQEAATSMALITRPRWLKPKIAATPPCTW